MEVKSYRSVHQEGNNGTFFFLIKKKHLDLLAVHVHLFYLRCVGLPFATHWPGKISLRTLPIPTVKIKTKISCEIKKIWVSTNESTSSSLLCTHNYQLNFLLFFDVAC